MNKKDKHIRISEPVADLIELYAQKTFRNKSVGYEIALKSFIRNERKELCELGIPETIIDSALMTD